MLSHSGLVTVLDAGFGARMDSVFLADLAHAEEIRAPDFAARPWYDRLLERGAYSLWFLL